MSYRRITSLVAATAALACGDEVVTGPNTTLTVTPDVVARLAVGDSVVLRARLVRARRGGAEPIRTRVVFASETPALVDVRATSDSTATVRALAAGAARVSVQAGVADDSQRSNVPIAVVAP